MEWEGQVERRENREMREGIWGETANIKSIQMKSPITVRHPLSQKKRPVWGWVASNRAVGQEYYGDLQTTPAIA